MDAFAGSMIARGPTLGTDRETATGSLHVLTLADVEALTEFVSQEPNNRAGVYREHMLRRFENLLGRSMWEFAGRPGELRFLIIGRTNPGWRAPAPPVALLDRLIAYGALSALESADSVGVALAVEAPNREAVQALIDGEQTVFGGLSEVEIHDWEFGGRR